MALTKLEHQLLTALKACVTHMISEYVQAGGDVEAATNPTMLRWRRTIEQGEAAIQAAKEK